jgi:hypothetical protein
VAPAVATGVDRAAAVLIDPVPGVL